LKIPSLKIILGILVLSASLLSTGFLLGKYHGSVFNPPIDIRIIGGQSKTQDVDFSQFWEVWDLLSDKYLFRDLDAQEMLYGAISGMVKSAGDPYTAFLEPELNGSLKDSLNGTYEGIGAELGMEEDQLIVVAPLDGSPAKAAGLKSRDKIIKVDSAPTAGITIIEAVSKIRGEKGSPVVLTLQRDGGDLFDMEIVRDQIKIPSITLGFCDISLLSGGADKLCSEEISSNIAYIRLSRFGDATNDLWDEAVNKLGPMVNRQELAAIILDLRGNPGGYLNSSVYIAQDFMKKGGIVLWQEDANGHLQAARSERDGVLQNVEVIVLIDEGSASASEIVAAALRDNTDAVLIGKQSFGKGTVQDAQDFADGSGLHITVGKWLTPNRVWVNKKGLAVDIEVELDEELYKDGVDTQLNKALELVE
jgi:carboxyl-terminal processing protease